MSNQYKTLAQARQRIAELESLVAGHPLPRLSRLSFRLLDAPASLEDSAAWKRRYSLATCTLSVC
jgi:hypothetical protein